VPRGAGGRGDLDEDDDVIFLTWNLGRRTHTGQVELIRHSGADTVALQEISPQRYASLTEELKDLGLIYVDGGPIQPRAFPFTSMIASRWPIAEVPSGGLDIPFPERAQVVKLATPLGMVEVLNVHVPAATSSGVAVKVATFEGIARYLSRPTTAARILCGDFNTPRTETDGRTTYWGSAHQQRAERAIIEGDAMTGLRDAFRQVHGRVGVGASWRASKSVTRRYDHVFASELLVPIEAAYGDLEQIRSTGLSDHAPLRIMFGPALDPRPRAAPTHEAPLARHVPKAPTLPIPTSREATSRKETKMPMADDVDLHAFLGSLSYRKDDRERPDDLRRTQFLKGWRRAVDGKDMTPKTLAAKLTWNNLGFRAGQAFGPKSDASIHAMFDRLGAIYVREKA
jgi:endonuclease/exonuclease/phosphatase family metal-dependent hydrolase